MLCSIENLYIINSIFITTPMYNDEVSLTFTGYTDTDFSEHQKAEIRQLICDSFEIDLETILPATYRFIAYTDDAIISHCAAVTREVEVNNVLYNTFLLGWMCTKADCRRKGIGRELLNFSIQSLRNSDRECAILNCGKQVVPFYTGSGFQVIANEAEYLRHNKREKDLDPVLALPLSRSCRIENLFANSVYLGEDF